jgi:hypothetical protein
MVKMELKACSADFTTETRLYLAFSPFYPFCAELSTPSAHQFYSFLPTI